MLFGGYSSFMDFIANNESSIICIRGFSRASMGEFILALNKTKNMDIKPFKHVSDVKKQRLKQENNSEISNPNVLLSKEQIDKIKASHIFEQWLNGLVDENDLTIEEKNIICAYQIYYELTLNDDLLYLLLGHYRASLERFVSDLELIKIISNKLDVPQDVLKTKALLMLKREEQEKVRKLTKDN